MIIPYQVDVPSNRWPITNYLIIGLTIITSIAGFIRESQAESFFLEGWNPLGLIGYMWPHADIIHLAGNLLFLWIFGNAVCSKVGNLSYVPIYLALGIIAGVTHNLFDGAAAVGASGAINGIVGIFLIWFPVNSISCVYIILIIIRSFTLDSYWMILLWVVFDIWGSVGS